MHSILLSTEELATHLADADWVIVDCRFDLAKPGWGFEQYQQAHIPGSVYAHLDHDLSGTVTPQTGRHPLPEIDVLMSRLESWGIGNDTQVVVYDSSGGAFAGRLWWLLRFLGHRAVAVLDGGIQKWQRENRQLASGIETLRAPAHFTSHPDGSMAVDTGQVESIRQDLAFRLVDARSAERFRGENEPIDPVAGHIPGAINRFHGMNLAPDGTFLAPDVLRQQFRELIGDTPAERVVVYCGSGVTSIHHLIAMELAGLHGAKLYPGSWSEWIRDRKRPIS